MNVANFYTVKTSKILQPLLAVMLNLAVVIKLVIDQNQTVQCLFMRLSKIAVFSLQGWCPKVI